MSERNADVPTMDEFNALEARVTALEEAQGIAPPEPGGELTESADGTRVTAADGGEIIDAALDRWGIIGGQVTLNGAVAYGWGVTELVYSGGGVYQSNDAGEWYGPCSADSGGAACPGDPTQPAPPAGTRKHTDIPFASDSVWNIGIGSNAQWSGDGDPDTQTLVQLYPSLNCASWGMPLYFGKASDPVVTVVLTDNLYPLGPQQIHIPQWATPALPALSPGDSPSSGNSDAHMAFYDETQPGKLWSYWGCTLNNGYDVTGGITAGLGGVYDAMGDGITGLPSAGVPGADGHNNHNDFFAGTLTGYDLAQGAIRHMLRFSLSPDATYSPGASWQENIPWPNTHADWFGYQEYTGAICCGCTIGIPSWINLDTMGLSNGGMMLARCLQTYGALWRDKGGSNQITFYSTPEAESNPLIGEMRGDLSKITAQLRVMRNQAEATPNGGGSYPAPLPAVW